MEARLRTLQLQKARLLDEIGSLVFVNDSAYTKLGKIVFEISQIEKERNRQNPNLTDDDN